jgi:DNA-binding NtrC family response regulator
MDPIKVLLVDDESGFLEAMHKRLSRRGLQVRIASGGRQALDLLEESPSDVVILDHKMPDMDGMETLRLLARDHPQVKVIMLSGHATLDAANTGLALGACEYLVKPCDLEMLLAQIEACMKPKPGPQV